MDPIRQFKEEGFCIAEGLLPEEAPLAALRDVERLYAKRLESLGLAAERAPGEATLLANMQRLLKADVQAYLAVTRHIAKLLSVQDVVCHAKVRERVRAFGVALPSIPTTPVVHVMSDQLKIPGGYYGIAPHQDWPSIQGSLNSVVVWVALSDVPADRFPLQVIPKSHLKGLWEGTDTAHAREIPASAYEEADFKPLAVKRGDVVFLSVFTVHRTGLQHEGKPCHGLRIGCNFRYDDSAEPTFVARDYPCAYKRTVERALVTPEFPQAAQVRALFD